MILAEPPGDHPVATVQTGEFRNVRMQVTRVRCPVHLLLPTSHQTAITSRVQRWQVNCPEKGLSDVFSTCVARSAHFLPEKLAQRTCSEKLAQRTCAQKLAQRHCTEGQLVPCKKSGNSCRQQNKWHYNGFCSRSTSFPVWF